jgi:hypothetical protein
VVVLSAVTCLAFPLLMTRLPAMMSRNPQAAAPGMPLVLLALVILVCAAVCFLRNRALAVAMVTLLTVTGYVWVKTEVLPFIDQAATARPAWQRVRSIPEPLCVRFMPRDWHYGLNYYFERALPLCADDHPGQLFLYYQNHRIWVKRLP